MLSATGTAAIINMSDNYSISLCDIYNVSKSNCGLSVSLEDKAIMYNDYISSKDVTSASECSIEENPKINFSIPTIINPCNICHIPKSSITMPLSIKMKKCGICKSGRVPDVLLATFELPETLQVNGIFAFPKLYKIFTFNLYFSICYTFIRSWMFSPSPSSSNEKGFKSGNERKRDFRWAAVFRI